MARRSLNEVQGSADGRLAAYTDPKSAHAFATYDRRLRAPGELDAEDIMMANLLDLGLLGRYVTPLFKLGEGADQALLAALRHADRELLRARPFEEHESLEALEAAVVSLSAANAATEAVPEWTAVAVSKVLHRRRPHIVPIIDSRVYAFYGTTKPQVVRQRLWEDLRAERGWLERLADRYRTMDGDRLSLLRVADIVIWTP